MQGSQGVTRRRQLLSYPRSRGRVADGRGQPPQLHGLRNASTRPTVVTHVSGGDSNYKAHENQSEGAGMQFDSFRVYGEIKRLWN